VLAVVLLPILGLLGLLVVVVLFVIVVYNSLQRRRLAAQTAWSDIDVQLKRRHDLVPNLVNTVKGYATHEQGVFERVTQARAAAAGARGPNEQIGAENVLTQALGRLFAVAEAYPQLKADANFRQLQEELTSTENKIGFARTNYNRSTAAYNEGLLVFPSNVVAGMFGFQALRLYEVDDAAERKVPTVQF
jgi:LemA protein